MSQEEIDNRIDLYAKMNQERVQRMISGSETDGIKEMNEKYYDKVNKKVSFASSGSTGDRGSALYKKCAGCHGLNGDRAALGKSAIIAGRNETTLFEDLKGYKAGTLNKHGMGGVMKGQVVSLSEEDMESVAQYISKLTKKTHSYKRSYSSSKSKNSRGSTLYKRCTICHGDYGKKAAFGKSAIIAGKYSGRIYRDLKGYKKGTLNKHGLGSLMHRQVSSLSNRDLWDLASYVSSLNRY